MTDDDGKDTQVLMANQVPFDLEGTEEMDRNELLAAIQADRASGAAALRDSQQLEQDNRKTEQLPSIQTATLPSADSFPNSHEAPKHEATQHYVVPESVLDQVRNPEFKTLDVKLEAIDPISAQPIDTSTFEFDAQIDAFGRIPLPDLALTSRFKRGKTVHVLLTIIDD